MTWETELYTRLRTFPGLLAIVPLIGTHVFGPDAPEGSAPPFLTIQQISDVPFPTHDDSEGLTQMRYQITVNAHDIDSARTVRDQVRAALRNWRGTAIQSATPAGSHELSDGWAQI